MNPANPRPALGAFFAATRRRTALWQALKSAADAWTEQENDLAVAAAVRTHLDELLQIESYFAYPGQQTLHTMGRMHADEDPWGLSELVNLVVRMLVSEAYRMYSPEDEEQTDVDGAAAGRLRPELVLDERPYFEVLVVDVLSPREQDWMRTRLLKYRTDHDAFVYDVVVVPSFEDALIAVLLNHNVQSVVIRYGFPMASTHSLGLAERALARLATAGFDRGNLGLELGKAIHELRPNLDLFLVSDANVEDVAGTHRRMFRRIFFRQEDLRELHLSLLKGIQARYNTPFFTALKNYSQRPTGVFHALPIARGKSVSRSHWIFEMEELFGANLFLAETSATTGGLDSLLSPHGSLKEAQALAARAFGAERTFFVTNGTSTANKIVMQALTGPGDIVLATRDCHMSHHYAFVLSGVQPIYMDPYPLRDYGFYGGVTLHDIKAQLLALRDRGELDRAKVLLLTNCTFDGIVYDPIRVMQEVLAIHPKMVFIWDEAWFAFAAFTPITRKRTGMHGAATLRERFASPAYRAAYAAWKQAFDADPSPDKWQGRLMADPEQARVRVYVTQSSHKTLTSLRQGSMIHVHDQDFVARSAESFHQAYLTHTSSSPNYPILASLDIGRRQVELEGYELVNHAIELAMVLRKRINHDPHLNTWFRILTPSEMVPASLRGSGLMEYQFDQWEQMDDAWNDDEFCLDPTRLTLYIGQTGIDGDRFKSMLIDAHDIQVNKTSVNTALFMTHIGTTRGAVAHLIDVLSSIADDLDEEVNNEGPHHAAFREKARAALAGKRPPLPNFSGFASAFRQGSTAGLEGDVRRAFFLSVNEDNVTHLLLDGTAQAAVLAAEEAGECIVSANFVTPYPPGFPVLVPGQVVSLGIIDFLKSVSRTEIHGYDQALGLRVLTKEALCPES